MAAAVELTYAFTGTVKETIGLSHDYGSDPPFTISLGDHAATLTATTTPAVTKVYSARITLAAGAATADLTVLVDSKNDLLSFTGLKVQFVKLACPSTNTVGITVSKGDSNAYNLFGADNASSESVEVMPGAVMMFYHDDELEDVDATHKAIKFAGTGTEYIDVLIVAG